MSLTDALLCGVLFASSLRLLFKPKFEAKDAPVPDPPMPPPQAIQFFATHTRGEHEQYGVTREYVLIEDGRIFRREDHGEWMQIPDGPWVKVTEGRG